jgi:Protein kinase domain
VIPVFCQILDGINHAHEYGIIHRDIKPANMMLTETGILKVLDFGIARLLGSDRMTRAGNIIGTLEYMAPEQVKGLETDARSDTYALGMMLYEVLTGRTPFNTENEFELMKLQTESMPPNPRSINSSIPESVEAAIIRAIQKNPDDRFQTAGDFREFLLDAGFVDRGALRRTTGPKQAIASTQSISPISKPEVAIATGHSEQVYKETRLGPSAAASNYAGEAKETRLGGTVGVVAAQTVAAGQQTSIFDRLTWVHFAGAGTVLAVIIGFVLIVPLIIFSGVFSSSDAGNAKAANANTIENDSKKVAIATPEPTKDTSRIAVETTPEPRVQAPIPVTPIDTPRPSQPTQPSSPPKRAKAEPPPARSEPPPAKPKPEKPKGMIKKFKCSILGQC